MCFGCSEEPFVLELILMSSRVRTGGSSKQENGCSISEHVQNKVFLPTVTKVDRVAGSLGKCEIDFSVLFIAFILLDAYFTRFSH